jgi:hypothetical protein
MAYNSFDNIRDSADWLPTALWLAAHVTRLSASSTLTQPPSLIAYTKSLYIS